MPEKVIPAPDVPPFVTFVTSAVPMVFDNSMSYYEALCALWKWLQDDVIDVINNNASVTNNYIDLTNEYTEKFIELKNYVDTYFDNLDVQEEINNKLDAMVEDGTLQTLINNFLQPNVTWTFDTVADMIASDNLTVGGYAQTLGFYAIGDGGGALYKITNTGTANEINIIALSDASLVAELVPVNKTIYSAQFGVVGDGTTDDTSSAVAFFGYDTDHYIVNSPNILIDNDIEIVSNSTIEFNDGCKITRKANALTSYNMLHAEGVNNVVIKNAHLVGDRDTHTGATGELGHGIAIQDSSDILVENCIVEKTWGDGYYIGHTWTGTTGTVNNVVLRGCVASYCSRNGFGLCAGSGVKIIDCKADHTNRTAPRAGLDIEPEGLDYQTMQGVVDCEVINFSSDHNTAGIQVACAFGAIKNLVIDGHSSNTDANGLLYSQSNYESRNVAKCFVIYRNAYITNTEYGVFVYQTDTSVDCSLLVQNINVDGCSKASDGRGIYCRNGGTNTGNITFDNIKVFNNQNLYDFQYLMVMPSTAAGTIISNIIVKNTDRVNCADLNHYTIACDLPNGEVRFINCHLECDIERETASDGYLSLNSYNRVYGMNCTKNTTVALSTNNPEGEYVLWFVNDESTPAVTHLVNFNASNSIFYGGTQLSPHYLNTAARSSYIRFYKKGTNIEILDFSGYTIS